MLPNVTKSAFSLRSFLEAQPTAQAASQPNTPTVQYKTFSQRVRHTISNYSQQERHIRDTLESDPAIQAYYNYLITRPRSKAKLSEGYLKTIRGAIYNFALFADLPITNHTYTDLIKAKQQNPNSTEIERAITAYASVPSSKGTTKTSCMRASAIISIFTKGNYTPLKCRVNTHPEPPEEDCTEGIFLKIYRILDQETKDMIQFGQYCPERAKAAYCVPLSNIDLSRKDYAIIKIQSANSKSNTKHPMFAPIDFARRIISNAQASGRNCPFPNHASLWKKVTKIAKDEFGVRLVSNYLRKRFLAIARKTTLPPAQAAFIMGDRTKLQQLGIHQEDYYGLDLRFMEELIQSYQNSGLDHALWINTASTDENPQNVNYSQPDSPHDNHELLQIIKQQATTIQNLTSKVAELTQLLQQRKTSGLESP